MKPLCTKLSSVATALEDSEQFLKKLNVELPYDTAVPLLGTYPPMKGCVLAHTCT